MLVRVCNVFQAPEPNMLLVAEIRMEFYVTLIARVLDAAVLIITVVEEVVRLRESIWVVLAVIYAQAVSVVRQLIVRRPWYVVGFLYVWNATMTLIVHRDVRQVIIIVPGAIDIGEAIHAPAARMDFAILLCR